MSNCPSCGLVRGFHNSVLQGCTCQWQMQAMQEGKDFTISKPWVGLTDDEVISLMKQFPDNLTRDVARAIEAKLKEKNT